MIQSWGRLFAMYQETMQYRERVQVVGCSTMHCKTIGFGEQPECGRLAQEALARAWKARLLIGVWSVDIRIIISKLVSTQTCMSKDHCWVRAGHVWHACCTNRVANSINNNSWDIYLFKQ